MTRKLKNLFAFAGYLILFNLVAAAQDTSYSTDSLMAAFSKGSQASLKGSEITVIGIVAEIKKSRVVFKSSGNDKVICELVSSTAIEGHPLGSTLTVVGKVRGRGLLGNVTLDQCNLASSNIVSTEPATIEPAPEPSEDQITQVEETTPVAVADVVAPKTNFLSGPAQRPRTSPVAEANESASSDEVVKSNTAITTSAQPDGAVDQDSNFHKTVSLGVLRAMVAVLLGIGVLLAFVKLGPAIAARLRPPTFPTTDAMRRSALEALLAKDKKH